MIGKIVVIISALSVRFGRSLNPLHDTSSKEFKQLAQETYEKVLPCLQYRWSDQQKAINLEFPDDAEEHFQKIKQTLDPYRYPAVYQHPDGFAGPWSENVFVNNYYNKSLHFFGGLIPIFVPWEDNSAANHFKNKNEAYIFAELLTILRPNVIYLAMAQGDNGLKQYGDKWQNILVISDAGYGHIIGADIKGEVTPVPPPVKYTHDISFYGGLRQGDRRPMMEVIRKAADELGMTFTLGEGSGWKEVMEGTKFALAPRGTGPNSFRFAEIIQMGRIPVFIYTDHPWVPYAGTEMGIETYGFVAYRNHETGENNLTALVHQLHSLTQEQFEAKVKGVQKVRPFFTMQGYFQQVEKFLRDPFGPHGGYLRCAPHPPVGHHDTLMNWH